VGAAGRGAAVIFNSVTYLAVYLPLAVVLYYLLPRTARLVMLVVSSCVFYGFWRWDFLPLMLYTIVQDYFLALVIERAKSRAVKRGLFVFSLVANLGLLGYFKYLTFALGNVNVALAWAGAPYTVTVPNIVLPLGISFYIFHSLSYIFDVYRGHTPAQKNFLVFAVYVAFFPQLVAGPILRASEVIPQLLRKPVFDPANLFVGLRRIVAGLVLKVVFADNIGEFVDDGFRQNLALLSALDVWTLCFLFGFQIYFDFSAYSHIALGSAKLMGIDFPENFNFPFFATSPREFWKRWHISLSSWIRDYLYLPLSGASVTHRAQGSTGGIGAVGTSTTFALFASWAIMGFWHGANWTFLYWGLFHAAWIQLYRWSQPLTARLTGRVASAAGWVVTLALSMASWAPFRAQTLSDALVMHGKLIDPTAYRSLGLRENNYLVAAVVMLGMVVTYLVYQYVLPLRNRYAAWFVPLDIVSWGVQLALLFIFLRPVKQFIYFQF
jgi:alginate O-acetyltransferase complex protein AlgI